MIHMKNKKSLKKILLLVPIYAILSLGTITLAKYAVEEFHSYYLESKNFYFTSNRLKKNTATYMVNNWSGVGAFDISFNLLSEKNSYIHSDFDIPYTVSFDCPNDVICEFDKTSGTIFYDPESNVHSDTVVLSVTPTRNYNENEELNIYIEANSTSPYHEKISANFLYVVGKQGITYEIEDEANRPYMLLKITNAINYCKVIADFGDYHVNDLIESNVYRTLTDEEKTNCPGENIILVFNPNDVVLDTTSNIINVASLQTTNINGVAYVNNMNFKIEPSSTMAIKFYKKIPANNYSYPSVADTSIISVSFDE